MNALWNQNYGANIRILLLNNEGGEIFHTLPGMDKSSRSREFITAEHYTTAKGWAEERGFIYMKVTGEEELEEAMQPFTSPETRMQPIAAGGVYRQGKRHHPVKRILSRT